MGRIGSTFRQLQARNEVALVPYLMVGYPSLESTRELLYAIVDGGADLVELGIPFSDPLADGATIQKASQRALANGASLRHALDLVASVRNEVRIPLVLMSYYNPLLRLGDQGFAREAAAVGVDGVIVPDLPVEESGPLCTACNSEGIDVVGMVAPTSPDGRIAAIAHHASGFVYCVALKGVTGARAQLSTGVEKLVQRVKGVTRLPAVVGFGISTPAQVRTLAGFADGVVVASALMDRIDRESVRPTAAARQFVTELKSACRRESPLPQEEG